MAKFRTASGLVDVDLWMRTASGLLALAPSFRSADGLIPIGAPASALSLGIDPPDAYGASDNSRRVTTSPVTATPTGGTAPYSFAWGAMSAFDALFPASDTTAFRTKLSVADGDVVNEIATCTVTDSLGATASATCSLIAENYGSSIL